MIASISVNYRWANVGDLTHGLPPGLRSVALEIAQRLSLPIDLIVINMLSALSSVFQGLYDYENLEGLARPISLNVIIVGEKASGKTKAEKAIFEGLMRFDHTLTISIQDLQRQRRFDEKIWRIKESVLLAKYRKMLNYELAGTEEIESLAIHDDNRPTPIRTSQLFYEKISLPKCESLLSIPGTSFTIASDEAVKLFKSGPFNDPGTMSQGWDGRVQLKDNMARTNRSSNARIGSRLGIQPSAFRKIFHAPDNEQVMVGLVQRCIYCIISGVAGGDEIPNPVKGPAEERFLEGLLRIAKRSALFAEPERLLITFSEKAKGAWFYLRNALRETSQWGAPLERLPEFQRRLMEHAERVSSLLLLGEAMFQGSEDCSEISDEHLAGAATVAKYYSQHAAQLYFDTTVNQDERDASKLQAKLDRSFGGGMTYWSFGVAYLPRNELLETDIVPGKKRFDPAMRLVESWGRYRIVLGHRPNSRKPTKFVIANTPANAHVNFLAPPAVIFDTSRTFDRTI